MLIIRDKITIDELKEMSQKMSDSLVKAVVDVDQNIIAVDAAMHVDEESLLLEEGSSQESLWSINIYPYKSEKEWIEFDSMINLRPSSGNRSRGVDNKDLQEKIKK